MASNRWYKTIGFLAAAAAMLACTLGPGLIATATAQVTQGSPVSEASVTPTLPSSTQTPGPTAIPATAKPGSAEPGYLDDRSTPQGVILSLYNAINRHEYLRAYSYWENTAQDLPSFEQFQQGYQTTASVEVSLGLVGGDAGAGQMYYTLPVVLKSESTSGDLQTYAGCYTLHLSQPGFQGEPPFQPLAVRAGSLQSEDNASDTAALLAHGCDDVATGPVPILSPQPTTSPTGVDASIYLDDRSGPTQVIRSLFNAVNRKEYVRAYSYWETDSPDLPTLGDFQSGYADTDSVTVALGDAMADAGAGQLHYALPVALTSVSNGGATQYFVGCYVLHLSQPAIQGIPPFQPLAIQSAQVGSVDSLTAATGQLPHACDGVP
jgi:hypothetical protein